jgi:pimeloyl-ACP methyl ester carboxylesterase
VDRLVTYRTLDVAVSGGAMRVGVWEPEDAQRTVLLVHGVTASHLAWAWLAEEMPDARLIAPDLRGRGRSSHLPGPVGMSSHARDLVAVLDAFEVDRADVAGHSMGAFIALVLAAQHPARVGRAVLVDGGMPLDLPEGMLPADAVRHVLGPTAARLSMTFASVDGYLDFWRAHPAFTRDWSRRLEDYFAYDLVGSEPALRPPTRIATVEEDSLDQNAGAAVCAAQAAIPNGAVLLAAERGLLDDIPPLYGATRRRDLATQHPGLVIADVRDVNHYTIAMSERGARRIAAELSG